MVKIYKSGQDFLSENSVILAKYPLETVFFEINAQFLTVTNSNDFVIRLDKDDKYLIAVHVGEFPMVIFGDNSLCADFARLAVKEKLTFPKVLGALDTCEAFLAEYDKLTGGTHKIIHAMDIMKCNEPRTSDVDGVDLATDKDLDELAQLVYSFNNEAMGESGNMEDCRQNVINNINNFAVIRKDNKIVSFASISRETAHLAAISSVYTLPQYRNMGLSCKIVTFLTKLITDSGKIPYLFVDKANPVSNHLYSKIGFTYATSQYEIKVMRNI